MTKLLEDRLSNTISLANPDYFISKMCIKSIQLLEGISSLYRQCKVLFPQRTCLPTRTNSTTSLCSYNYLLHILHLIMNNISHFVYC